MPQSPSRRGAPRDYSAGGLEQHRQARLRPVASGGGFDADAMIRRFRERAAGVKRRNLPPVAGEERRQFLEQARVDFQDFAIIGDAEASLEDGILRLEVDLRPPESRA